MVSTTPAQTTSGSPAVTGERIECKEGRAGRYPCENVDLLSHLPNGSLVERGSPNLNDIWGWTDPQTGTEYALVGRINGVAFVDVSTPTAPVYVGSLPTHTVASTWRDVKVYANHAFVVSEAPNHGMQVFDLTNLRDVAASDPPVTFSESAHYTQIERAHNVVINRESGFAYVVGGSGTDKSCGGGLHMVNVQDPLDPTFAGCFADPSTGRAGTGYTHDAQCVIYDGPDSAYQGGEICFNANETALNIADVTDKEDPSTIANATYPQIGYVHQAWLSETHRYLYVDDELDERQGLVDSTRTLVFDVTDLDNPELATSYSGTTPAIDHNQYIDGPFSYQANYQSGLRILDITAPERPVETAYFDTYPEGNESTFDGAWSVYPFFDSGIVVVSSIGEGLFVLKPDPPPVSSVTATRRGQGVRLRWQVSAVAQTDRIEVERKPPESTEWILEDTIIRNSGGSNPEYERAFEGLRPGAHQFRIRHVSTDGKPYTSRPVTVRILPTEAYVATGPFPNPVQEQALFKIILRKSQDLRVALYDALGRRVSVLHDGKVRSGVIQRFHIQARRRSSGMYFLRVTGPSIQLLRKINITR